MHVPGNENAFTDRAASTESSIMGVRIGVHFDDEAEFIPPSPAGTLPWTLSGMPQPTAAGMPPSTPALAPEVLTSAQSSPSPPLSSSRSPSPSFRPIPEHAPTPFHRATSISPDASDNSVARTSPPVRSTPEPQRSAHNAQMYRTPATTSSTQSSSTDTSSGSSGSDEATKIHQLLAWRRDGPPALAYDLTSPPNSIPARGGASLDDPALQPASHATALKIATPCGTVRVARAAGRRFIGCRDVLRALHAHLATPVHPDEFARLPSAMREEVSRAFYARCDAVEERAAREEATARGVLRVDLLAGKTRFGGLARRHGPGEWELRVLGPGGAGAA